MMIRVIIRMNIIHIRANVDIYTLLMFIVIL